MSTLREKLQRGDIRAIARMAGVHYSTAEKTVYGTRNNAKVKEAARMLLESREAITRKLQTQA
jgi:hypothetical protein